MHNLNCNIPFKYDLDCSTYIKLSKYKNCKDFIDNDMEKTKERVLITPYFSKNQVIISKQTVLLLKQPIQYISLHMFKL